eukprot:TRINITY_DN6117_c0_g1_i1.p1 TRINITY_DN6117_c0_g1~~TRINITY_DN6117_c0_g1_i1.p1  ORF type:complete len:438 (-),score=58.40 TRINITY_DN6117_c0_g1_i1:38-1324(-)
MHLSCAVLILSLLFIPTSAVYLLGEEGESCYSACASRNLNCNPRIQTDNTSTIFTDLNVTCNPNPTPWWAENQPCFVSNSSDARYGDCLGYINVPGGVFCGGSYPTVQRVCRCDELSARERTFGYGYSGGPLPSQETTIFQHFLFPGTNGVMTHLWTTSPPNTDQDILIRYYIDGETEASIEMYPGMAAGVGFDDQQAPWGTKWFGKGADTSGWFFNFKIPFVKSVIVTATYLVPGGLSGGFYIIARGASNVPINIGGILIPPHAKLNQIITNATFQPLEWVDLVDIPSGPGLHFMHTLAVSSGTMNFLEGCYHMYYPGQEFPGTLLSTGTEDYFDSAWYFNAGEFHLPVSGYTHYSQVGDVIQLSAYRFHEMDPLVFDDGFKFVWRNGDVLDPAGIKCLMESAEGGTVAGDPTVSNVTAYSWVYTWS